MINVNYRDSRPIYEQIKDGFKKQILTGIMKKDEKLPSVRDVASELAINPNTIQRAYRDLEAEGYIYSVAGKGSFVEDVTEVTGKRRLELTEALEKLLNELQTVGVSEEECMAIVHERYKAQ